MGRLPIPDKIKEAKGTLYPHRVNENKPQVIGSIPSMPEDLDAHGKEFYNEVATRAHTMDVISEGDRMALYLAAQSYSLWKKYREFINDMPPDAKGFRGAISLEKDAYQRVWIALKHFGLTPVDRDKVSTISRTQDVKTNNILD